MKDRPAFKKMVDGVLADGVAHVVALKLDRLGRSARGLLELFARLEAKGVGLVCIDDSIDTGTPTGKLLRTILAGVAEFERDVISERTKTGMAEARRRGARFGKASTLDPAVVARIRADRASGMSLSAIARALDAEGIRTGQGGKRWYASTVRAIALGPHPAT